MPQQSCVQCGTQFTTSRSDTKFCGSSCRYKFWLKDHNLPRMGFNTIEEVKEAIEESKKEFKKIQGHFARVMSMYDDFETVMTRLENRIVELENSHPDIIEDLHKENELLEQQIQNLKSNNEELKQEIRNLPKKLGRPKKTYDALADIIDKD